VGMLCASAGRWGSPADARCAARRVQPPFGPLAWRPPLAVPPPACPDLPAGPAGFATPGAPPASPRRGQAAAARVGTLCASAGRRDSPAAALVAHGCLPLRHPLGSASARGRRRRGLGSPVPSSVVPPSGALSGSALAPYPGSPPHPLLTACPPPSRGGAGPAVLFPAFLRWACGGSSGLLCVFGLSCCPCL
jgi:hypothetical protein